MSLLPGKWSAQFEKGPNGESYAWLGPAGGDARNPAFLVRRRHDSVVLADRITDPQRTQVSQHHGMTMAMRVVFASVLRFYSTTDHRSRK
ncbi:MAG: hypothetical protein WDN25_06150 [Acetobacteraceae bacterium]